MNNRISLLVLSCVLLFAAAVSGQTASVLRGVKTVQIESTVVPKPEKVKEASAPNLVEDSLRNALKSANFEVGDSPIHGHIVLEEFTSGSTAKRVLIGMGAGRSSVTCRLIFSNTEGKEVANIPIHVRGSLAWSPYQGNNTQRRQAVNSFDQRLLEEIEKLK